MKMSEKLGHEMVLKYGAAGTTSGNTVVNTVRDLDLDMDAIIAAAVKTNTALEVSANALRLDLNDVHCRLAVEAGAKLIINTDAHDVLGLHQMRYGVATAQRGWVTKADVLNCRTLAQLRKWIADKRKKA